MDYKGWILSIYDEYIERYNRKYNVVDKKIKIKDVINNLRKKENRTASILKQCLGQQLSW